MFVIGGAEVYKLAFGHPEVKRVLLTEVRKMDGGGEGEGEDGFGCDTFLQDFRGEDQRWRRREHEELCAFVGEDVPSGIQVEGGVGFEYQLWEKEVEI